MSTYSRPVISVDAGMAEGVYAASGSTGCYDVTAKILTYVSCNGNGASCVGGNGTPTLTITLTYHQNPGDNIGFGDLCVTSDAGLAITGISISD